MKLLRRPRGQGRLFACADFDRGHETHGSWPRELTSRISHRPLPPCSARCLGGVLVDVAAQPPIARLVPPTAFGTAGLAHRILDHLGRIRTGYLKAGQMPGVPPRISKSAALLLLRGSHQAKAYQSAAFDCRRFPIPSIDLLMPDVG